MENALVLNCLVTASVPSAVADEWEWSASDESLTVNPLLTLSYEPIPYRERYRRIADSLAIRCHILALDDQKPRA